MVSCRGGTPSWLALWLAFLLAALTLVLTPAPSAAPPAAPPSAPGSSASTESVREDFTAVAMNLNSRAFTTRVDIRITRWSTDEEREQLLAILNEGRSTHTTNQRLLRALQRMPRAGFIRRPGSLSWDLRYTQQQPLEEGGRQLVIATDRPVNFWEARNQPRVSDFPFTLLELRLDAESRGEGKMLAQTRLRIDSSTNTLVLDNYARLPVQLNRIRPR